MPVCVECTEDKSPSEFYAPPNHKRCKQCRKRYYREKLDRLVVTPVTHKVCSACKLDLPAEAFNGSISTKTGLQAYCKTCATLTSRCRKYGVSRDELIELIRQAQGRCALCSKERPLCVDHNHKTGRVRGLICGPCNLLLGHAKDDAEVLLAAVRYLAHGEIC